MLRRLLPIILFFALFLLCIGGAWAWFHVGNSDAANDDQTPRIWLTANTNIPGYTFEPKPLTENELKILATTNIVNGTFVPAHPFQISDLRLQTEEPGASPMTEVRGQSPASIKPAKFRMQSSECKMQNPKLT